jgi:hypothetical protein
MQVTKQRLLEMQALLTAMGKGSKMPSDGLGLFLGDGTPRNLPGSLFANTLRSNELLEIVHGMLSMHDLAESHQRFMESLERLKSGDTSDLDPELLELAAECVEARKRDEQAKLGT